MVKKTSKKKVRKQYNIDEYLLQFCLFLVLFIFLPFFGQYYDDVYYKKALLLYINPVVVFFFAFLESYRHEFKPFAVISVMVAFLMAVALIYVNTDVVYIPFYGIIYFLAGMFGYFIKYQTLKPGSKKRRRKKA